MMTCLDNPFLRLSALCPLSALILCAFSAGAQSAAPAWWQTRGVLDANAAANDYAALNAGQLKNLAYADWLELETLPGGAGFAPAFTNGNSNYAAVNVGQLRETARPFYERLGLSAYPPVQPGASGNDFALANVGQAKFLFGFDPHSDDFDGDGLPNAWEGANGTDPLVQDAAADPDGDGLSNLDECLLGSDPLDAAPDVPGGTPPPGPAYGAGESGLLILTPGASGE
jgi:hypothetical protein